MTALVLSAMLAVASPIPGDVKKAEEQFQKDIAKAREKAIEYLKKQQKEDGSWEGGVLLDFVIQMKGGTTALATLALLEAGVPANDAAIAKAVEYLVKLEPEKTYVVGLQTQVLDRADAKKHAALIQRNADWLLDHALGWKGTGKIEGWSYPQNKMADNSNTHFAVMGLHAAAQAGAKIDAKVWREVRAMYTRTQLTEGGWTYFNERGGASFSMTTCGVLGLAVVGHYGNAQELGDSFKKGMAAMIDLRGGRHKSEMYRLFATAELGRMLEQTEFKAGKKSWAWYREDAEKLLKKQNEDGSFGTKGDSLDGVPVLSTAFGLYFLGPPPKK
jgi:hypothetical protein